MQPNFMTDINNLVAVLWLAGIGSTVLLGILAWFGEAVLDWLATYWHD